jgi:hypothetical protein
MKYRLPSGAARLSHAGKAVTIAGDGTCDLDPGVAALLAPHGIVPVGDPAPIDPSAIASMAIADLQAALLARGIATPVDAGGAQLRSLLRRALAKPAR